MTAATTATTFEKTPEGVLDYSIDWSAWLQTGEIISNSVWEVDTGITVQSQGNTDTATTVYLSGGAVGTTYLITNEITTDDSANGGIPRVTRRSFKVKVKEPRWASEVAS